MLLQVTNGTPGSTTVSAKKGMIVLLQEKRAIELANLL